MLEKSFGLFFFLKKPKNEKGNARYIYLRLTVDGISKDVATKRQWDNLRWNASAGRATGLKVVSSSFSSLLLIHSNNTWIKLALNINQIALCSYHILNVLVSQWIFFHRAAN